MRLWTNVTQWGEGKYRKRPVEVNYSLGIPQPGDDVLIPCPWTLLIDIPNLDLATVTIDGTLRFDENYTNVAITTFNFKARNIWVRGG